MEYSCARQLSDGAWFYGDEEKHHWIDAFHTGYNLDALKRYQEASGDTSFSEHLERGYGYFVRRFIAPDGRVRYYHNKTRPIDIQCASQAIDTLSLFAGDDPTAGAMARKIAQWYVPHMQDRDGHFHFRYFASGFHNRTPMIHWGQATMHKALAHLVLVGKMDAGGA
jgi:hypothetical protein